MDKNLAALIELEIAARNTSHNPEMYWLGSELEGKAKVLGLVSYTEEKPWKIEFKVKVNLLIPHHGSIEELENHPAKGSYDAKENAFTMDMDVVAYLDIPDELKNKLDVEGEKGRSLRTKLEVPGEFHRLVVDSVTSVVSSAYDHWYGILNLM